MKQVLIKDGSVVVVDVPAPVVGPKNILVRVAYSCISTGTEMASVQTSGVPLYRRALRQPDNVRRVIAMIREQGVQHTLERVRGKLESGSPTGYSAAGTVVDLGGEVEGFRIGDGVACAGAGIANHAELIDVPVNLAVRLPDGLDLKSASTVTLGAIALQGVRRAQPSLGETCVVVGLGLLGLLTVQLLRAHGSSVIGVDPDARRRNLAELLGARVLDPVAGQHVDQIIRLTNGDGADGVIITAATQSDEVISEAFRCCRKKGRVVIVGDVGLKLRRSDFYTKEIDLLISASYGPGRYDPYYEEGGQDYPLGYVRWTENRNMSAYLHLLAEGRLRLEPLEPQVYPVEEAAAAYDALRDRSRAALIALLKYPEQQAPIERIARLSPRVATQKDRIRIAVVGAGGFAQGMHLPNLQKLRDSFVVRAIVSRTGSNARAVAQRYGAEYASTDIESVLADGQIDLLIIATRHHLHANLALRALRAGKHVFVEKPLALTADELDDLERFFTEATGERPLLMTGFNRRFSPGIVAAKRVLLERSGPMLIDYRMNAGHIPSSHWVHGAEGGGRNVGEACHIYDVFQFLTGSIWTGVSVSCINPNSRHFRSDDNFVASVTYSDGSVCTLTYTALGAKSFPKERMDVFCDGMVLALDDYRELRVAGRNSGGWSARGAHKGQLEELQALACSLQGSAPWPISLEDQLAVTRLSFAVEEKLKGSCGREQESINR
jgi:predicted dehydrogenase/threonine dehydrogenase-like Zn-dependent dehydrogenase